MANPLAMFLILATPVAFVVMVMLWRRSRTMSVDPWYGESSVAHSPGESACSPLPLREPCGEGSAAQNDGNVNGLDLCKKVLFCWDYWSSGKSGLDLQDVFEARNLPAELRAVITGPGDESRATTATRR